MNPIPESVVSGIVWITYLATLIVSAFLAQKKGFFKELRSLTAFKAVQKFVSWLFGVWVAGFIIIILLILLVDLTR